MFKTIKLIVMAALCLNFSSKAQRPDTVKSKKDTINLNEIQIIGYGQTTKRLNTGSVSNITAKQIEQQPVTNVLSALSGRMPGVFVQTTNGLPGGNINIQIRGKGSLLAGTNPLYIVDGVPYDGNQVNKGLLGDNNIAGAISPLNNINPNDIENITVLKDADATSIYGSRGANGVVLIRTKSAKTGATSFDLNVQKGYSRAASLPKFMNLQQYLALRKEAFQHAGKNPSPDPNSADYAPDLTVYDQSKNTNWSDFIYGGSAPATDIQSSLSGGSGKTGFTLRGNYRQEGTVLPGNNKYQRGGLSSRFRHQSENDKFSLDLSTQLNIQDNNLSNVFPGISNLNLPPNFPLNQPDGSLNWDAYANIQAAMLARSRTKTNTIISSINMAYQFNAHLKFAINSGYTRTTYNQTLLFPEKSLMPGTPNYSILGNTLQQSFITEPQLEYHLKMGKHTLTAMAGGTYQSRLNEGSTIQAGNFKLESLMQDLGSAGIIDSRASTYGMYKYVSAFGRLSYNYAETYVLNATLRRDGSSRFGPGNRFGNFGSLGAAWIFSNLKPMETLAPFLSLGKLRLSYGTTGNDQISDYQYLSTYSSPSSNIYQDIPTIRPSRISNADFRWETTRKFDLALELGLFQDRISFSAGYYISTSKDQLVNYSLPQITGFSSYQANLPAEIRNTGLELSATASIYTHNQFNWSLTGNITLPRNELKSFENFESSSYAKIYELGTDISRIYGAKALGINPQTGQVDYAGLNGQASASPYQFFTLGKLTPDFFGGIGNTFKWGILQLDVFAQFAKQQAQGGLNGNFGALPFNNFAAVLDRSSASNTGAILPSASLNYDGNLGNSSLNVFDTSYLRIKTIYLSCQLPATLLRSLHLKNLKAYLSGQNLFTIWKQNAAVYDPESAVAGNVPPMKTLIAGLQFSLN